MKHILPSIFLFLLIVCSFSACKKDQKENSSFLEQQLISSAKKYFHDNLECSGNPSSGQYRIDLVKSVEWQAAYVSNLSNGPGVIVPIRYPNNLFVKTNLSGEKLLNLNEIAHLILYKDQENVYHAEIVTSFPDTAALANSVKEFSGITFVEDWAGKRLHQFIFKEDGTAYVFSDRPTTDGHSTIGLSQRPIQAQSVISTCYTITGYNYASNNPDGGYSWSEPGGCWYMYIPDRLEGGGSGASNGGSGGGSGGPSGTDYRSIPARSPIKTGLTTITRGPNTIANIQDYIKCFTNVGGVDHTYSVTICIDQPIPGTRSPWRVQSSPNGSSAANNPIDVGHTFLVFSESYGGTKIIRNVGFYPRTSVDPWYPSDQGQLNDNEGSNYNISLTISATNAQFFNMLNYVSQGNNPGYSYNLNTNNCTTFALNTLQAGDINLSSQTGSWFKGSGLNPGDLGEDVRNMPLLSNMTRGTEQNAHPNVGNCN
jgi:hypothetical protein